MPDGIFNTVRENFWTVIGSAIGLYILWQALKPVQSASARGFDVQPTPAKPR